EGDPGPQRTRRRIDGAIQRKELTRKWIDGAIGEDRRKDGVLCTGALFKKPVELRYLRLVDGDVDRHRIVCGYAVQECLRIYAGPDLYLRNADRPVEWRRDDGIVEVGFDGRNIGLCSFYLP